MVVSIDPLRDRDFNYSWCVHVAFPLLLFKCALLINFRTAAGEISHFWASFVSTLLAGEMETFIWERCPQCREGTGAGIACVVPFG